MSVPVITVAADLCARRHCLLRIALAGVTRTSAVIVRERLVRMLLAEPAFAVALGAIRIHVELAGELCRIESASNLLFVSASRAILHFPASYRFRLRTVSRLEWVEHRLKTHGKSCHAPVVPVTAIELALVGRHHVG